MAKLVEGGGEPVNKGEVVALRALAAQLDDEVRIIPNWTVVHGNILDECDAIVVTRDAVFIVETKFLAGRVEIGENDFWVDGSKRTHPYLLTNNKAQRLRTKLNNLLPWFGQKGRVEAQVVLATRPRELHITPHMVGRVIGLPVLGETLNSPSPRVHPMQVGRLEGKIDEVVSAITSAGRMRERERFFVPGYRIDEVTWDDPAAGFYTAIGTNLLTGLQQSLEVFQPLPGIGPTKMTDWRIRMVAPARAAAKIGPHQCLLSPTGVVDLDDGTVVLISPLLGERSLGPVLDGNLELDAAEARSVVADIADALAHVHAAGHAHRMVDPMRCALRPGGRGILRFGTELAPAASPEPIAADLGGLGGLCKALGTRVGDDELMAIGTELTSPGNGGLTAADVSLRLAIGQVAGGGVTLSDLFSDLEPLTGEGPVMVFAGTDAGGSRVAIKLLAGSDSSDPNTWREYRLLRDIDHPSIVRTFTAGVAEEGPFITTELLAGASLSSLFGGEELDETDKTSIAVQLLSALAVVHPDAVAIAELMKTGDPEDAALADELRSMGVVHNDISPENVRWIPERGAVLFDFDSAGRLDSYVGKLAKPYRPADVAADVAAPDADIYAVGALLHELLTGLLPYEFDDEDNRLVRIDEKLEPGLRAVLEQACAARQEDRFRTATEFLDALVAAGVDFVDVEGDDILVRIRRIESLIAEGDYDQALEECDESWVRLRERIEKLQEVRAGGAEVLLTVDGVQLRRGSVDTIENVNAPSNNTHEVATAYRYQAVFNETGAYLEFAVIVAEGPEGPDVWMAGLSASGAAKRQERLLKGLRPGSKVVDGDPTRVALRLRAAILDPGRGPDWSTAKRATAAQLDEIAGFDVAAAVMAAGGLGFGTHEQVFGDTSRNRQDLCVLFDPSAENGRDAAAIGYFASRVMALWRADA